MKPTSLNPGANRRSSIQQPLISTSCCNSTRSLKPAVKPSDQAANFDAVDQSPTAIEPSNDLSQLQLAADSNRPSRKLRQSQLPSSSSTCHSSSRREMSSRQAENSASADDCQSKPKLPSSATGTPVGSSSAPRLRRARPTSPAADQSQSHSHQRAETAVSLAASSARRNHCHHRLTGGNAVNSNVDNFAEGIHSHPVARSDRSHPRLNLRVALPSTYTDESKHASGSSGMSLKPLKHPLPTLFQ